MQDAANILKSVVWKNDWYDKRLVTTLYYVTGSTERSWHPRRDRNHAKVSWSPSKCFLLHLYKYSPGTNKMSRRFWAARSRTVKRAWYTETRTEEDGVACECWKILFSLSTTHQCLYWQDLTRRQPAREVVRWQHSRTQKGGQRGAGQWIFTQMMLPHCLSSPNGKESLFSQNLECRAPTFLLNNFDSYFKASLWFVSFFHFSLLLP